MKIHAMLQTAAVLLAVPIAGTTAALATTPESQPVLGSYAGAYAGAYIGVPPTGSFQLESADWDFRSDNGIASDSAFKTAGSQVVARSQADAWTNRAEIVASSVGPAVRVGGFVYSGSGINQRIEGAPGVANVGYDFSLDGYFQPGDPSNFINPQLPQQMEIILVAVRGRVLEQREVVFGAGPLDRDFRIFGSNGVVSIFQDSELPGGNPNPNYVGTLIDSIIPGGFASVCYGPDLGCLAAGAIDGQLSINFDIGVGEDYWVGTILRARTNGNLDFWNTLKLETVVLAPQFTLVSEDGGVLQRSVDGSYGLPGAVPEPSSWALMIAGFGLVGGVARRRRSMVA
jgi:hypothetical protein